MEEKLKNVFEKEYSENSLTDFLIKTQKVYEFFDYDFKLTHKNPLKQVFYGAKIWINDDYKNSLITNLENISLNEVYPKLISKIAETNLENFNEVYSKLIELYSLNKNTFLKKYINMAYGCLQNPESVIYSNNIHLIPIKLNNILSNIQYEFKGHVVYIDNYEIIFRNFDEIKERFEKYFNNINKYDLTYFSEKSKFGFFVSKKHYIIEKNNVMKIKGMKHFNKDGICKGGYFILSN